MWRFPIVKLPCSCFCIHIEGLSGEERCAGRKAISNYRKRYSSANSEWSKIRCNRSIETWGFLRSFSTPRGHLKLHPIILPPHRSSFPFECYFFEFFRSQRSQPIRSHTERRWTLRSWRGYSKLKEKNKIKIFFIISNLIMRYIGFLKRRMEDELEQLMRENSFGVQSFQRTGENEMEVETLEGVRRRIRMSKEGFCIMAEGSQDGCKERFVSLFGRDLWDISLCALSFDEFWWFFLLGITMRHSKVF